MICKTDKQEKKSIGLWISTALVSGNMIGSGVFLLPAALAFYGGISLFGWLFSTLGAILLALVFSYLSKRKPMIGGPYIYTRDQFGPLAGFLVAWGYWISIWVGNAAISTAAVGYLGSLFPVIRGHNELSALTAILFIWFFTWVNTHGIRTVGKVQLVTTIIKIAPLIIIGSLGFLFFNPGHFHPLNLSGESNATAIQATAALTIWAFLGLESATIPADKVRAAVRTIPRATILGTLIAALVYISSTTAVMGILDPGQLGTSEAPFSDALTGIWGSRAGMATAVFAIISCLGALNGWILLQGQIPLAAASDALFPPIFERVSKKGTPVLGILISSILATILIITNYTKGLVGMFTFVIMLASLATLIPYFFSSLAQIKYLIKDKKNTPVRAFLPQVVIAILAALFSVWVIGGLGFKVLLWGLGLLLLGLPFYYLRPKKAKQIPL